MGSKNEAIGMKIGMDLTSISADGVALSDFGLALLLIVSPQLQQSGAYYLVIEFESSNCHLTVWVGKRNAFVTKGPYPFPH